MTSMFLWKGRFTLRCSECDAVLSIPSAASEASVQRAAQRFAGKHAKCEKKETP